MFKIDLWQAASTIASLGVVVGVVFLAIELRHGQTIARLETYAALEAMNRLDAGGQ